MKPSTWVPQGLYDRVPTFALERFLGAATVMCGLLVLAPWWSSFGPVTALHEVPEWLTGSVLMAQGLVRLYSLGPPVRLELCRTTTWIAFGNWTGILITFMLTPPRTLFVVGLVASLAGGNLWVWLRLYFRCPYRGTSLWTRPLSLR